MDIDKQVTKAVAEQLDMNESHVKPEDDFISDLGCDSLDLIELVMAIEEACDVDIPDDEAEACATVADAIALVRRKTEARV